jgi:hypothetical protein
VPVGGGGSAPQVSARLLNRTGAAMSDVPVSAGAAGNPQIELPLAGLAPGEYILEIKTGDDDGSRALVGFRVTG